MIQKKLKYKIPNSRKIIIGFLVIIFLGAFLLMLPIASKEGESTTFIGALFCSVSATCVTGLVAYDTYTHWTLFGQLVLLIQMQIGGLGFITIGTFMLSMSRRKIGVSYRVLIRDSLSTLQLKGSVRLVRRIIGGTIFFEGVGAFVLAARFAPQMGFARGLYFGVFHAVSAFCNAGFDLMGCMGAYSSLAHYAADPVVILTVSLLIIVGGIGFVVWEDLIVYRFHWKRYHFHTKLVLSSTAILLVGGTCMFWILENKHLLAGMSGGEKFLASFFSAVTPRTAGFNSIDTASLSNGSMLLTIILMFIGGSPGSTAGGIKTVTLVVILLHLRSYVLREKESVIFGRRLEEDAVRKASVVVFINLIVTLIGMMIIFTVQELPFRDVMFEVFSAIGTVGMSTGVTRKLNVCSKIVIILLMFLGRLGSLTFAMSFTERKKTTKIRHPEESIMIG